MERDGTTRLKVVEYDSMSGENVWVNWDIMFTSVRAWFMSLTSPKNHGFVKLWISEGGKSMENY